MTPEHHSTSAVRREEYRARIFAERESLVAAAADAEERQRNVLARLLDFNAETDFGRTHGFGRIRSIDDFRKAVPVQDFSAHAPWIERMAAGEDGVLTADRPTVYFTSSGSTGAHKKIPVTPAFMRTTFLPFYYAAWAPLAEHFPDVLTEPGAVLNLKHDPIAAPPTTASGRPHVGASQVDLGTAFGEPLAAEPGTAAPWGTLPVPVDAGEHLEKMYLRLRLAVESDVRCVIGINPAMVAAVPYQLDLWWPRIVQEIHDGVLGGHRHGARNPARARELEGLAAHFGTVQPSHIWPNMRAIFCWTTGVAALYLPRLRERFGAGVSVLPAPVAASEGPVGVALDRHASAGHLVASASVYEFVDAEDDLKPDAATLLPHELEAGRDYHVLFSHIGGFYRYAVGDVLRVADFDRGVPRLEYAGRGTRSDVAGERLRDAQVVRALIRAATAAGVDVRNAACRPDPGADLTRYTFAVAPDGTRWTEDETGRFATALDAALEEESSGYRSARRTGRLGAATVGLLDTDAFARDWQTSVASGVRPTQVKDRMFRPDPAMWEQLTGGEVS